MASPTRRALALSSLLAACAGARPAAPTAPAANPPRPTDGWTAPPPSASGPAQAVALPAMPTCTAGDLRSLVALTPGVPAHAALARRDDGGLAVFVHRPSAGHAPVLAAVALTVNGQPHGGPVTLSSEPGAEAPAVAAFGQGYRVVFRAAQGASEKLVLLTLGADGSPQGQPTTLDSGHFYGLPALRTEGDRSLVAVARGEREGRPRRGNELVTIAQGPTGAPAVHAVAVPPQSAWEGDLAPGIATHQGSLVALAQAALEGPAPESRASYLAPFDGSGPATPLLRNAQATRALSLPSGTLLTWRTTQTEREVAVRSWWLPAQGGPNTPPQTLSVFEGAFGASPVAVSMGARTLGVFTLSTLADDAGGTLNLALLDANGSYLGRRPLLLSSLTRGAQFAAASSTTGNDAWVLFEGRGDAGAGPVLGLAPVECDAQHPQDARTVPPPTLAQRLAEPDEAALRVSPEREAAPRCHVEGAAVELAQHSPAGANRLADTSALAVSLPAGQVAFVLLRAEGHSVLRAVALGAARAPSPLSPSPAAEALVAAGRWGSQAAALILGAAPAHAPSLVTVSGSRVATQDLAVGTPSSAVFAHDGSALWLVAPRANSNAGPRLWQAAGIAGLSHPRELVALSPGDRVVDVLHRRGETLVLLARPESQGALLANQLAVLTVADRGAAPSVDPFADPVGHGTAEARWVVGASAPTLLWRQRTALRVARFEHGELVNPRSVLSLLPDGGTMLASTESPTPQGAQWFALQSGHPAEEVHAPAGPFTLASVDAQGAVTLATTALPGGNEAIVERLAIAASGAQLVLVYAHTTPEHPTLTWSAVRATCTPSTAR